MVGISAAALTLAGCGDDDATAGTTTRPASGADGAALYADNCASCHGGDLRGTDKGPSHLSQVYEPSHHPDDAFRSAIANGSQAHHWDFGDMPPVEGLSDGEVNAIIAYVREQQEEQGFIAYPPP